jgi:hypothetical protein
VGINFHFVIYVLQIIYMEFIFTSLQTILNQDASCCLYKKLPMQFFKSHYLLNIYPWSLLIEVHQELNLLKSFNLQHCTIRRKDSFDTLFFLVWVQTCSQKIFWVHVQPSSLFICNISDKSWQFVLFVEETGVPWENHRKIQ